MNLIAHASFRQLSWKTLVNLEKSIRGQNSRAEEIAGRLIPLGKLGVKRVDGGVGVAL
jgi:hypothetical protein